MSKHKFSFISDHQSSYFLLFRRLTLTRTNDERKIFIFKDDFVAFFQHFVSLLHIPRD